MMLLRGEVEPLQTQADYYPLTAGMEPRAFVRFRPEERIRGVSFSTGQGPVTWQWIRTAGDSIAGDLLWPDSFDAAEAHATSLLTIAETSMLEGCTVVEAPPLELKASRTVRLNDVSVESVTQLHTDYAAAVKQWRTLPRCAQRPPR